MKENQKSRLKTIIFLVGLLGLILPMQVSAQGKLQFGASAGLDFTMLAGTGQVHPRAGFSFQGVSSLTLMEKLSLQGSLGYAFRPYHLEATALIFPSDVSPLPGNASSAVLDIKGSYHEFHLPILLKFHLQSTQKGPYIGAGPMAGVAIGHTGRGVLRREDGSTDNVDNLSYRAEPRLALQAVIGHRLPLTAVTDLSVELYGNAYAGQFFLAPAKNYTAGARVGLWL